MNNTEEIEFNSRVLDKAAAMLEWYFDDIRVFKYLLQKAQIYFEFMERLFKKIDSKSCVGGKNGKSQVGEMPTLARGENNSLKPQKGISVTFTCAMFVA